jgi:hypothetical protein
LRGRDARKANLNGWIYSQCLLNAGLQVFQFRTSLQ